MVNEPKEQRGPLLARGKGVFKMLDVSYKRGLNDDNSILVVKDMNDLDSTWSIYKRK